MTWSTLRFERDGHVARLVLDRPEKLNAFTPQMWSEMRALGAQLLDDPGDVRVLVVAGEGRAFSSGIDTGVLAGGVSEPAGDDGSGESLVAAVLQTQEAFSWLEQAPFATIAAVRGYALGAGLQLALACDIRVLAHDATVGLLEHRYGIIPDLGGTQRLPRLVGPGQAKRLVFTAATIDAHEAHRIGLCEHVVPDEDLDAAVAALVATIAAQPPLAVAASKRAINAALDGPIANGLRLEAEGQAVCLPSADTREAITAFVEGRAPVYRGR